MKTRQMALVLLTSSSTLLAATYLNDRLFTEKPPVFSEVGSNWYTGEKGWTGKKEQRETPANDFIDIAREALSATVHITTKSNRKIDGWAQPSSLNAGSGSGVIISPDGYIITNNHVIDGAGEVVVSLNNKKSFYAKVIGTDPVNDLAVLKIEASGLPILLFGNSDLLKPGQWVLAVGYPLGLEVTVTAGIVSAKGGALEIRGDYQNPIKMQSFIQTDAVINRGNSGGPLINTAGQLIGINSYLSSATGAYSGYSFSIPVNTVKRIVMELIKYGKPYV